MKVKLEKLLNVAKLYKKEQAKVLGLVSKTNKSLYKMVEQLAQAELE